MSAGEVVLLGHDLELLGPTARAAAGAAPAGDRQRGRRQDQGDEQRGDARAATTGRERSVTASTEQIDRNGRKIEHAA